LAALQKIDRNLGMSDTPDLLPALTGSIAPCNVLFASDRRTGAGTARNLIGSSRRLKRQIGDSDDQHSDKKWLAKAHHC
jgi:hypothetical protein